MMRKSQAVEGSSIGSRQANMNKFFNLAIRPLLTACSKQDICKAFPSFTTTEQEQLYRLFIQVVTSLHASIEVAFETECVEDQVGIALDTVEQLVEEQALDPLHSEKTNVTEVAQTVLTAKKNEVENLTNMLQMAEKQNQLLRARVEALRKGVAETSSLADTVEMVRRGSSNFKLQ